MEPEAIYTILSVFSLVCLFSRRPRAEEEFEDSDIDAELMDDLLDDLRKYADIAREVLVKRANGDVIEVKFRSDEPAKVVHNVADSTSRMVWAEGGRHLQREETWGGEEQ